MFTAKGLADHDVQHVFDGETPSELLCAVADSARNCALVNFVGAHAATGYPLVVSTLGITIGPSVDSDTPGLRLGDLDDDNLVDVFGLYTEKLESPRCAQYS